MRRNPLIPLLFIASLGAVIFWWITRPEQLDPTAMAGIVGNAARGELVFWAGGCASCHAAPGAEGAARLVLSGGRAFPSPFGTFLAPNISPDPTHGIGTWSALDLANAMRNGTAPDGAHYYPAFPYSSYARADLADIADLHAYLVGLPASSAANQPHQVGFPFTVRRLLGGWKWLFSHPDWVMPAQGPDQLRGRYLVESLGHCGECHTPRNALGGLDYDRWLQGAPDPTGKGKVPGITPAQLGWNALDIAAYLATGFTPEYDSAGGHMAEVVQNMANLPQGDLNAIAAYLLALPDPEANR